MKPSAPALVREIQYESVMRQTLSCHLHYTGTGSSESLSSRVWDHETCKQFAERAVQPWAATGEAGCCGGLTFK